MSLGVHVALSPADEADLLAVVGDDSAVVGKVVSVVGTSADGTLTVRTDAAWDPIHRCLTGGGLQFEAGPFPLSRTVLGGRQLYQGDDHVVCYVSGDEVRDVAAELEAIDEPWLRNRYQQIDLRDYDGHHGEDEFAATWTSFVDVRDFFARSAEAGHAVVFTVSA